MMYFRHEKDNGLIEFIPFYDGCAYIHCIHCGRFIPIFDLTEFLADSGGGDDIAFYSDICDACLEEQCCREEEYLGKHRADSGK